MKHCLIKCGHAVLSLAIGMVIYGCSDTGSVSPVVELASLTVDPGTLRPAFSGGTTHYNVDLTSDTSSVTVTAQPAVAGDSVTINGQATTNRVITLGETGTTTPVSIVVSESGTNSRTYTVLINRAGLGGNNSLRNLTVSSGTSFRFQFSCILPGSRPSSKNLHRADRQKEGGPHETPPY